MIFFKKACNPRFGDGGLFRDHAPRTIDRQLSYTFN